MLKAVSESVLEIAGYKLKTVVLEDGTRMFDAESFNGFWKHLETADLTEKDAKKIARFVKGVK